MRSRQAGVAIQRDAPVSVWHERGNGPFDMRVASVRTGTDALEFFGRFILPIDLRPPVAAGLHVRS